MIEMFTNWIKHIIFIVLFASFLELLLPSSGMQRFVRVIMGLFIMLTILGPAIDFVQQHVVPAQILAVNTRADSSTVIIDEAKNTAYKYDQLTTEVYVKELAQQMKVMIKELDGVADAKVVIDINSVDHKVRNMINHIVVYVTPGSNTVDKIKKITIGQSIEPITGNYINLQEKIKKMIAELYQIPKEKVEIKIVNSKVEE